MKLALSASPPALLMTGAAMSNAFAAEPAMSADSSLGKILVDPAGMTLYTFDNDTKGRPLPPAPASASSPGRRSLAPAGATAEGEWTIVDVTDKDGKAAKMWAYNGLPLYYFVKDKKAGDVTGNGVGDVWHVVKE